MKTKCKKTILYIIALFAIIAMPVLELSDVSFDGISIVASAASENGFEYKVFDETATIIGCDSTISGKVIIPKTLGGYVVTDILWYAFSDNTSITEVIIPDTVTYIGECAFSGCDNLQSVSLSGNITRLQGGVFSGCKSLREIVIPDSVVIIENAAFANCETLSNISLSENIKYIGAEVFADTAFYYDNSNWIDNVLYINDYLIKAELDFASEYEIKDGTKTIAESAFEDIDYLSLTVPNTIENMWDVSFVECDKLTLYYNGSYTEWRNVIENSKPYVEYNWPWEGEVYYNKEVILDATLIDYIVENDEVTIIYVDEKVGNDVIIPEEIDGYPVTRIEDYVFTDCYAIKSIYIPDTIKEIGKEAFNIYYYNNSLEEVHVRDINAWLKIDFQYLDEYKDNMVEGYDISSNPLYVAKKLYVEDEIVEELYIPEGIENIKKGAFYGCLSIKSVHIPKSVKFIDSQAFGYCRNITDVYYDGTEEEWENIQIGVYNYELLDKEIHFKTSHSHDLKTATFPATCIASGMTYSYCTSCGDTVGETTIIPALGHKVGNWETVTEPTTENEGKKIQTCSVCGEKLCEEIIPKLEIIIAEDKKTGVSIEVEKDSVDGEVEIRVEESHDGVAFNLIDDELSVIQSFIYDIKMIVDGTETQPNGKLKVKIPVPEGYIPERTRVFHVNTKTGKVENMNAVYEDGYMVFKTDHFSYYALVEEADVKNCSCNCHKGGIAGFFFKIILFFQKLFRTNKTCACGVAHY